MDGLVVLVLSIIFSLFRLPAWRRLATREELGKAGLNPEEISLVEKGLKTGHRDAVLETLAISQERQREAFKEATGTDLRTIVPTIGEEVSWKDIHLQVFKVLEFDRAGTIIGPNDEVKVRSLFSPYGYLLVQSPILNQPVRLPIIHRDDFWLAASVFDDPNLTGFVESDELLVTYAPRKILADGRSDEPSHVLHYLLAGEGTLDEYYSSENDLHMAKPNPRILFGQFVYDGEIRVQVKS